MYMYLYVYKKCIIIEYGGILLLRIIIVMRVR